MSKLKEYQVNKVFGNENVHHIVVCKSRKRASELLNTQDSYLRDYGYTLEPRTQIAIDNPEKVYGYVDSGIVFTHRPDMLNIIKPIDEIKTIITELKTKK